MLEILILGITWLVLGVLMATADALSPTQNIRVGLWISLFFIGVLLTFLILSSFIHAVIATVMLTGIYMGPYGLTWQLWMFSKGNYNLFPVTLYPFPISVTKTEWYVMLAIGFMIFFAGVVGSLIV